MMMMITMTIDLTWNYADGPTSDTMDDDSGQIDDRDVCKHQPHKEKKTSFSTCLGLVWIGEKLKGRSLKGSFDKHVRIDLPLPVPVPTPESDPKPLPQGHQ